MHTMIFLYMLSLAQVLGVQLRTEEEVLMPIKTKLLTQIMSRTESQTSRNYSDLGGIALK